MKHRIYHRLPTRVESFFIGCFVGICLTLLGGSLLLRLAESRGGINNLLQSIK